MDSQTIAMKKLMELGVTAQSGKAVVSSRDIARVFEKRHGHVLRDIREIINKDPAWGAYHFGETPYTEPQNGQTYTEFNINRDGFTILIMGYTGEKAMRFKKAYIAAFNEMERRLAPQNYKEALLALVAAEEEREAMGFVEVKDPGKVPPPLQEARHRMLRRLGLRVYVLDRPEQIANILLEIGGESL
jgi:Rha family phage regulatory protein